MCLFYCRYNFSFQHSGPLDDDRWHLFMIVIKNGVMDTSLDGANRNDMININVHHYFTGQLRLGYYEDNDGTAYHFQGSLGVIDALEQDMHARLVWDMVVQECAPGNAGRWGNRICAGMHLATPLRDCASRGMLISFFHTHSLVC